MFCIDSDCANISCAIAASSCADAASAVGERGTGK
jgi:hypothetical protein